MSTITQREEFLFLYDVTNANPNGDPLDENKPRLDEETGYNIVTDVRLKRTVRDYFSDYQGHDGSAEKDIFVRTKASAKKDGIQDGKARVADFKGDRQAILERCIDIRLFGGVLPMDKNSITLTGPVQLKMGRSLHRVALKHLRGTGAFASNDGAKQRTFREEYIQPYSLICFYGVINEHAARDTGLSADDVDQFYNALWEGTRNLLSRSKMGHMPRLLLRVKHAEANFFIGDLDKYLVLQKKEGQASPKDDEEIRDIRELVLDLSAVTRVLDEAGDRVAERHLRQDTFTEVCGWNP